MSFQRVADVEDIRPGTTRFLSVGGRPVVLARVGNCIFALDGICPHRYNPLEGATLIDYWLDCPWHHFQYDVRTGQNHFPANVYPKDLAHLESELRPLGTYAVLIKGSEIWLDLE